MTTLALQAGLDMPVVPKLNVFGQAVNLNPFNGPLLFPMLLQDLNPLNFVVGCRELCVAAHAQLDRGNAGGGRTVGPRMAVLAVDPELACVMLVAERNGLDRARRFGIPGQPGALASTSRGPLTGEFCGNLDGQGRVFQSE